MHVYDRVGLRLALEASVRTILGTVLGVHGWGNFSELAGSNLRARTRLRRCSWTLSEELLCKLQRQDQDSVSIPSSMSVEM